MEQPNKDGMVVGNTNNMPEALLNLVDRDRLLLDTNALPSYITLQAASKNNLDMESVSLPVPPQLIRNNNLGCDQDLIKHTMVLMSDAEQIHTRTDPQDTLMKFKPSSKKPCPLEMSIKAANLDTEFAEESYALLNGITETRQCNSAESISTLAHYGTMIRCDDRSGVSNFPNQLHPVTIGPEKEANSTYSTESTFELTIQPASVQSIQPEALRVLYLQVDSPIQEPQRPTVVVAASAPEQASAMVSSGTQKPQYVSHTEMTHEVCHEVSFDSNEHNRESLICEVEDSNDSSSLVSDDEEEALVLKIRKIAPKPRKRKQVSVSWEAAVEKSKQRWERIMPTQKTKKRGKGRIEYSPEDVGWSDSDDELLADIVKRRRNDDEYETNPKSFRRAPKCCPRLCHIKIQPKNQEMAFRSFLNLEDRQEGDRYLANCIQYASKTPAQKRKESSAHLESEPPSSPWPSYGEEDDDMSVEIANESNGNQTLSDEIQNAIKESLRDQETAGVQLDYNLPVVNTEVKDSEVGEKEEKQLGKPIDEWQYFIVINSRLRMVCLKFLLSVLRIPQTRVEALQKKIIEGEPLERIPVIARQKKCSGVWLVAKKHLDSVPSEPVPYCRATPPHRYLVEAIDRRNLYDRFRDFHLKEVGKELTIRFDTYRRFVQNNGHIAFRRQKETSCAGCDCVEGQAPYRGNSGIKGRASKGEVKAKERKKNSDALNLVVDSLLTDNETLKPKKSRAKTKANKDVNSTNSFSNGQADGVEKQRGKKTRKAGNEGTAVRRRTGPRKGQRGDVFSLMITHLKTVPSHIPRGCVASEAHRFFSPANVTIQMLYEDYRKYFLKETNSELGLRFAIYESLFLRNPYYAIIELDTQKDDCPKCLALPRPALNDKKHKEGKKKLKIAVNR